MRHANKHILHLSPRPRALLKSNEWEWWHGAPNGSRRSLTWKDTNKKEVKLEKKKKQIDKYWKQFRGRKKFSNSANGNFLIIYFKYAYRYWIHVFRCNLEKPAYVHFKLLYLKKFHTQKDKWQIYSNNNINLLFFLSIYA